MKSVKLYSWQPNGHGQYSFFVASESLEDANMALQKYIDEHIDKDDEEYLDGYSIDGIGTDYYKLTISDVGTIVSNAND